MIGELDVRVELSAGVRDDASLEWALSTGCARIILGATALADLTWYTKVICVHSDRIAVGLDVRTVEGPDGSGECRLTPRGWAHDVSLMTEVSYAEQQVEARLRKHQTRSR